jgi:DNA-binding response OmpR family regulator
MGAILIVENEPILAMELQAIVEDAGFGVAGPVATLDGARRALRRTPVAAALLDVALDGGAVIYPLAEELALAGTPFIFATANGRWVDRRFALVPVVHKPYRRAEILGALRHVLQASSRAELRP